MKETLLWWMIMAGSVDLYGASSPLAADRLASVGCEAVFAFPATMLLAWHTFVECKNGGEIATFRCHGERGARVDPAGCFRWRPR